MQKKLRPEGRLRSILPRAFLALAVFLSAPGLGAEEKPAPAKPVPALPAEANPVPVPAGPFSLQTCFELAVLRSETLGMKEEDIRVAQAQYWQALSGILPKVHFLVSERVANAAGGSSGSVSSSADNTSSFFSGGGGSRDSFQARVNVKQPIFSGFREFYGAAAADANISSRRHDRKRTYQLLYLDTADVFYQILMYEGDLKILGDIQKALEERIAELDRRVELGKSRTGELLMAKADLAASQAVMEQMRGLLGASRELMAFLTGVPAGKISLADRQPLPAPAAIEAFLRKTGERPDILAAIDTERSARKQLSAVKGEHWPTISAEGNYFVDQHPDSQVDWNVFLTFDMPLFEGGLIEARINENKALVRQSQLSLEQLRRTADREVRTAYNNFLASAAQAARLQVAREVAGLNYRAQTEDYRLGIVNNLDVLEALRQKYNTTQQLHDAEMEARVNLIRLHVAAGAVDEPAKAGEKRP